MSALGPLSIDVYLPSFPAIAADLGISPSNIQFTLSSYFLGLAIGQLSYGPVSDRIGRKGPLFFGFFIYFLASILCAMSTSIEMLTVGRFLQAIGGSASMVIGRAVVRDRFDEKDSVRVFSLLMLVMGAAPILGPFLGSLMVSITTWRAIFWFLALYGLFCYYLTSRLDETISEENRAHKSPLQVLKQYGGLLTNRHLMSYSMASSFCIAGLFAYIAGSPLIFLDRFKIDEGIFGMFFGLNAMGVIVTSQLNRKLISKFSSEQILGTALLIMSLSSGLLLAFDYLGVLSFGGYVLILFFVIAPLGTVFPNSTALAMEPMGRTAGVASAVMGTLQFGFGAISTFMVGYVYKGSTIPINILIFGLVMMAFLTFRFGCPKESS